jgi:hypothetical protein
MLSALSGTGGVPCASIVWLRSRRQDTTRPCCPASSTIDRARFAKGRRLRVPLALPSPVLWQHNLPLLAHYELTQFPNVGVTSWTCWQPKHRRLHNRVYAAGFRQRMLDCYAVLRKRGERQTQGIKV